jgi:hypothetical protein
MRLNKLCTDKYTLTLEPRKVIVIEVDLALAVVLQHFFALLALKQHLAGQPINKTSCTK